MDSLYVFHAMTELVSGVWRKKSFRTAPTPYGFPIKTVSPSQSTDYKMCIGKYKNKNKIIQGFPVKIRYILATRNSGKLGSIWSVLQ